MNTLKTIHVMHVHPAMSAGLAYGGMHPVVALYATFLNRGFDQLLMDVALHKAGVTVVLDRSGSMAAGVPGSNLTKMDLADDTIRATIKKLKFKKGISVIPISAVAGEGVPELLDAVWKQLSAKRRSVLPSREKGSKHHG